MASKKIIATNARTADAIVTEVNLSEADVLRASTITNNLVDAERILREQIIIDLARIKSLLYGEDTELDLPPDAMCAANNTWNVMVLAGMAAEITGDILRRL